MVSRAVQFRFTLILTESWVPLKIRVDLNSNVFQIQNKLNKIIKIGLYVSFDVLDGF